MTTAAANTIIKDTGVEGPMIERLTASGTAIKPGHFLRITTANEFNIQNTQGADVPTLLAIEDKFKGDAVTGGGVDATYLVGEVVRAEYPPAGALRYARVPNGATTTIGDALIFNNAGQLIRTTGTPSKVVAWAEEAITSAVGEQLILVRIA